MQVHRQSVSDAPHTHARALHDCVNAATGRTDSAAIHAVFKEHLAVILCGPAPDCVVDVVVAFGCRAAAVDDIVSHVVVAVLVAAAVGDDWLIVLEHVEIEVQDHLLESLRRPLLRRHAAQTHHGASELAWIVIAGGEVAVSCARLWQV